MENAKKFFEEVIKTEEAKAILAATQKPETEQELVEAYLEIAKKLNFELTSEGIRAYFKAAEKPVSGELDDDELAQLTGGSNTCEYSFLSGENCWAHDGCDFAWNSYTDYMCKTGAKVDEFMMSILS